MKFEQIQQEILRSLEPRLNEIAGKIMIFWRDQWKLWEQSNYEAIVQPGYQEAMNHSLSVCKSYVYLYEQIAAGDKRTSCTVPEAIRQINKAYESYIHSIERNQQLFAKKRYAELCGYDSSKSYAVKENRMVMSSYAYTLVVFFMKGRKAANARMHRDAKDAVDSAKAKLFKQVQKVLGPIADDIQTIHQQYDDKSPVGLVGVWIIHTKSGQQYRFKTQCIEAGGYNIQCWHYRYICSLQKL